MKRVTIRDVAALAGVSRSTVSRVLNGHPSIGARTRKAVHDACEVLNYVPDITAKGLAGQKTHTIGVIVPDISNPYFSALCTAVEACAAEKGYRVMLTNTLHDPDYELEAVEQMYAQRVDGMVIAAVSPRSQERHAPRLGEIPCVYLGSNHGPDCSYVEVDNEQGAYEATQYLYRLGHRRIVFLGGRKGSRTLEQRLAGYRRSMLKNGLAAYEYIAGDESNPDNWCYEQACRLFRTGDLPDAFLAYSDRRAIQILEAAEDCGFHAPRDFSLVGFDDIVFGGLPQIMLTSVSQCSDRAGSLAMERLLEKIGGDDRQTADILKPELVIRGTCRKITSIKGV